MKVVLSALAVGIVLGMIGALTIRMGARKGKTSRALLSCLGATCYLIAPVATEIVVTSRTPGRPWFVDLPVVLLLMPPAFGALAAWLSGWGVESSEWRGMAITLLAWSGFFGAFNTANLCNPGWCGRYGFPVPYYVWSDAILVWNGVWPQPFHPIAVILDGIVYFAIAFLFVGLIARSKRGAV